MWTPSTADAFKTAVALAAREAIPPELTPMRGMIAVHWVAYLPRPKRLMGRKCSDGPLPAMCKPDRDNIDKAICDALVDAGVIGDDKDIWSGSQKKFYAEKDGAPRAEIMVCYANTESD
jgi:Holliday junction resolvase RusA-like endonuclease